MPVAQRNDHGLPGELRALYPIAGLLHVGAGLCQNLDLYRSWKVPVGVLVEADDDRMERLTAAVAGDPRYAVHHALLAESEGEAPFHLASNRNESGLVEPERLAALWPNLATRESRQVAATTIAALVGGARDQRPEGAVNWVLVDCLPALDILKGAGALIDTWDVVVARVLVDRALADAAPELGASALDRFMAERSFRVYAVTPEHNPGFAQVVYARDWKARLGGELAELRAAAEHSPGDAAPGQAEPERLGSLQPQLDELAGERDAQAALAADARGEVEQLAAALEAKSAAIEAQAAEHRQQVESLEQRAREAEQRLALAHADLDHLREQFAALTDRHAAAQALLREIKANLVHLAAQDGPAERDAAPCRPAPAGRE
jgi:hypothetical protein